MGLPHSWPMGLRLHWSHPNPLPAWYLWADQARLSTGFRHGHWECFHEIWDMDNKGNRSLTFEIWGCIPRAIKNIVLTKHKESQRWEKEITTLLFPIHETILLFWRKPVGVGFFTTHKWKHSDYHMAMWECHGERSYTWPLLQLGTRELSKER